jgi:hypothetical protein
MTQEWHARTPEFPPIQMSNSHEKNVNASEAKQSTVPHKERMDYFVAFAPHNDVETHLRIPAARIAPESCIDPLASKQRAWGTPGTRCTRSLVREMK